MGQDGTDWGSSWTSSRLRSGAPTPRAMVAPGGRQCWRGPLRSPFHSNVSPYRQSGLSNLRVDRQIRSPNKSETEVSTRRGFRSELYPGSSRRQIGVSKNFRGQSSRACWRTETSVSCHDVTLMIQGNSSRLAETGRDRSPHHARRAPDSSPSFAFDSRADYRDEAVSSPITRSLSERWLIVLVQSVLRHWIPLWGVRCVGFEIGGPCDGSSISVEDCDRLRRRPSSRRLHIRSPNKSETEVSDPSGLQIGTIPRLIQSSNWNQGFFGTLFRPLSTTRRHRR
jgi:hypothetical protein